MGLLPAVYLVALCSNYVKNILCAANISNEKVFAELPEVHMLVSLIRCGGKLINDMIGS